MPPKSTKPLVTNAQAGADASGEQTATAGKARLTGFGVYSATVIKSDLVTRRVTVKANGVTVENCIYAAGAVAAFMGFTSTALPPAGANVVLMYLPQGSYVLGAQPLIYDTTQLYPGTVTGIEENVTDIKALVNKHVRTVATTSPGYAAPSDLLPGEQSIENNMGVVLRMLYNFEQLSAGDLAKIEVHLLNDMVRIVDNYFVHHNVGGDTLIWSNGRCNYESHFTSYPHEAEGKLQPTDMLIEPEGQGIYDPNVKLENVYSDTGRWRKSTYVGFLADMIHTWVTDPTAITSTYAVNSLRAGKYRSWVGSDGTVMVQTVSGVQVEVVPRIVVPAIPAAWNDPEYDAADMLVDLDSKFLKMWGTGPDWRDLSVACWQMRNYAKYIALYHSLERFKQLEDRGGCYIPTEMDSPVPDPTCGESDKAMTNPDNATPYNGHALFSMDPSGSVTLIANGNTSVIMNQGNIQVVAPGNVEIQAGGTLALTGQKVSIKALGHVEIASLAGSLVLKARTAWKALCEAGRIWLKSDASENSGDNVSRVEGAWPLSEGTPIQPESGAFGIVLDSVNSQTLVHGSKGVVVGSTESSAPVRVQATGGNSDVTLHSSSNVAISAANKILAKCASFGVSASMAKIAAAVLKLGDGVRIVGGILDVLRLVRCASFGSVRGYIGPDKYVAKYQDATGVTPDVSAGGADSAAAEASALSESSTTFQIIGGELANYVWSFADSKVGDDVLDSTSIKAPPLNDTISVTEGWEDNYVRLHWSQARLIPQRRTEYRSCPWPGRNAKYFEFGKLDTPAMGAIWDRHFTDDNISTFADMKYVDYKIYFNKNSNEI